MKQRNHLNYKDLNCLNDILYELRSIMLRRLITTVFDIHFTRDIRHRIGMIKLYLDENKRMYIQIKVSK